jgi:hypothetical protein
MMKAKLLAVFAAMIAVLAVSAAPAFAEFESNNGKATGAGKSGPVVLEGGGATLECSSAEGTGTILKQGVESTKGTVLALNTTTWNGCKAKSKEIKEVTPKVKACTLKLTQAAGNNQAKGSVGTECTVETTVLFFKCVIHVAAEKSGQPPVNFGLEANHLENVGNNLVITAEDSGITTTTSGTCPGITGSSNNKQKATVTGENVKWV